MRKRSSTSMKILNTAQQLVQRVGFNGFSYADLSTLLGIKKASIHYHFPTKMDLIITLVQMYREEFCNTLTLLEEEETSHFRRLERFIQLYGNTLKTDSKLCLCSILSLEVETLPNEVREEINLFFRNIIKWLSALLDKGVQANELAIKGSPETAAELVLAVVKGAQLLARNYQDLNKFNLITNNMLGYYLKK